MQLNKTWHREWRSGPGYEVHDFPDLRQQVTFLFLGKSSKTYRPNQVIVVMFSCNVQAVLEKLKRRHRGDSKHIQRIIYAIGFRVFQSWYRIKTAYRNAYCVENSHKWIIQHRRKNTRGVNQDTLHINNGKLKSDRIRAIAHVFLPSHNFWVNDVDINPL